MTASPIRFLDPARARLGNGLPCWRDDPLRALPSLTLRPTARGTWLVGVMVGGEERGQHWGVVKFCELALGGLEELLAAWAAGPEEALVEWWGVEAPRRREERSGQSSELSAEELGL